MRFYFPWGEFNFKLRAIKIISVPDAFNNVTLDAKKS